MAVLRLGLELNIKNDWLGTVAIEISYGIVTEKLLMVFFLDLLCGYSSYNTNKFYCKEGVGMGKMTRGRRAGMNESECILEVSFFTWKHTP